MPSLAEAPAGGGLVLSAITGRTVSTGVTVPPRPLGRRPSFPSPEFVGVAAATLAAASWAGSASSRGEEGPRWFVTTTPGSIQVSSSDLARGQRALERQVAQRATTVALLESEGREQHSAAWFVRHLAPAAGRHPAEQLAAASLAHWAVRRCTWTHRPEPTGRPRITGWTPKSRSNMVRRLVSLDYGPLLEAGRPVMVTLTYPGDWLTVAPDGAAVKAHLAAFRRRLTRHLGGPVPAVWKQEYQRRGAPHFHLLLPVPVGDRISCPGRCSPAGSCCFRATIALWWSEIVAHPDLEERARHRAAGTAVDLYEADKMTDPKRVAIYFTKHGLLAGKEYQNHPPAEWTETGASVGRFWGYWTLKPAEVCVEVSPAESLRITRTLRRWHNRVAEPDRGRGGGRYLRAVRVWRTDSATGRQTQRTVRRPVRRMRGSAGFLSLNSGPDVTLMLEPLLARGTTERAERRERFRSANRFDPSG